MFVIDSLIIFTTRAFERGRISIEDVQFVYTERVHSKRLKNVKPRIGYPYEAFKIFSEYEEPYTNLKEKDHYSSRTKEVIDPIDLNKSEVYNLVDGKS